MKMETETSNWLTRSQKFVKKEHKEGIFWEGVSNILWLLWGVEWKGVEDPGGDSSLFFLVLGLHVIFHEISFSFLSMGGK